VHKWRVDEWYPNERHLGYIEEAPGGYRMTFEDRDIKQDIDVALARHPSDLELAIDEAAARYSSLDFKLIS